MNYNYDPEEDTIILALFIFIQMGLLIISLFFPMPWWGMLAPILLLFAIVTLILAGFYSYFLAEKILNLLEEFIKKIKVSEEEIER